MLPFVGAFILKRRTTYIANKGLIYSGGYSDRILVKEYTDSEDFIKTNVDGYPTRISLSIFDSHNIDLWCDDDGKSKFKMPSAFIASNDEIIDVIAGTIVFTKHDDKGATVSLTNKDIKYIKSCIVVYRLLSIEPYICAIFICDRPQLT